MAVGNLDNLQQVRMIPPYASFSDLVGLQQTYASLPWVDASASWRAASFRATAGLPMTLRRAEALNAVLMSCPVPVFPGALLAGVGHIGRCLPADAVPADQLAADRDYVHAIGCRTFGSQSDHHAADYPELLRAGLAGVRSRAAASRQEKQTVDAQRAVFLDSVVRALDGALAHLRRWSAALAAAADEHPCYAALLRFQAAQLARLACQPPATFHDALQLVYSYHCMMQLDDRGAMAFGRLDQYLRPFWEADLRAGRATMELTQDLLDHFFARITIDEDVQNIVVGGTRPDGGDGSSLLSCQILEACKRVGRPGGNCTARLHSGTPAFFLDKCVEVISTGIGYPSVVNEEPTITGLLAYGYRAADARDFCSVGCIETQIPGRQAPWTDRRINPLKALHLALFDGVNILNGQQEGPRTGDPATFDALYGAFQQQFRHLLDSQVEAHNGYLRSFDDRAGDFTSPLLSALVQDCIGRGRDVNDGGALYEGNIGYGAMGIASLADSLAAVRRFVYERPRFSLDQLRAMLRVDFVGYEAERQLLLRGAPKFGNDDDEVDGLAVRAMEDFVVAFNRHRTPRGGFHWMLMASNVQNISAGQEVAATPDGRHAGQPTSDACSPTFGRDQAGPTAAARSVSKLPYHLAPGGNVVNMKISHDAVTTPAGRQTLGSLIRACFALGGSELQFNTTATEQLRAAMADPEPHEDLVVRVSGFSARFTRLGRDVQEDILARTEHALTGGR